MKTVRWALLFTALAGAALAGPAAAADWLVSVDTAARARGDGYVEQYASECSGTRASASYCGGNAIISPTKTALSQSASAVDYPNTSYYSGYGVQHGDGFASADLTTGELKIATDAYSVGGYAGGENTAGSAYASFIDTLHFDVGTGAALVPIVVDLRLDGSFQGYVQPGFGFGMVNQSTYLNAAFQWTGTGVACTNALIQTGCDSQAQLNVFQKTGDWSVFDADRLEGTFYIDPAHPDITLSMEIGAGGSTEYGPTFAAFSHTAALQFELPDGVSFTSDSGAFLSAFSGAAVPEPATWAMLVMGLGMIGYTLRGRRGEVKTVNGKQQR